MTISCVVFDLDGTLVDASADIAEALNVAFLPFGVRTLEPGEVASLLGGGPRVLVERALGLLGVHVAEKTLEHALKDYSAAYQADPTTQTVILADAGESLPALREAGMKLAVCTNKRTEIAKRVLVDLELADFFDAVVGSDVVKNPKPHPDHLLETLSELGCSPSATLYVGDTSIDAAAAHAAGVAYVQVAWAEESEVPAKRIRRFAEILDVVGGPQITSRD